MRKFSRLNNLKRYLSRKKQGKTILRLVESEMAYLGQFGEESEGESDDTYMSDLASVLITSGIDAHFVLYEMHCLK